MREPELLLLVLMVARAAAVPGPRRSQILLADPPGGTRGAYERNQRPRT
jgi:hypothetical protein